MDEYPVKGRGGLGVKVANLVEARGELVGALITDESDEVLCIMASGKVMRSAVAEVSRTGRNTQGVTFAKPDESDRIIAVARSQERDLSDDDATELGASAQSDVNEAVNLPLEGDEQAQESVALDANESEAK